MALFLEISFKNSLNKNFLKKCSSEKIAFFLSLLNLDFLISNEIDNNCCLDVDV